MTRYDSTCEEAVIYYRRKDVFIDNVTTKWELTL